MEQGRQAALVAAQDAMDGYLEATEWYCRVVLMAAVVPAQGEMAAQEESGWYCQVVLMAPGQPAPAPLALLVFSVFLNRPPALLRAEPCLSALSCL